LFQSSSSDGLKRLLETVKPRTDPGIKGGVGCNPREAAQSSSWFSIEADHDTGYDAATDVIACALTYLDHRTRSPSSTPDRNRSPARCDSGSSSA
jgi:hypothetical protein